MAVAATTARSQLVARRAIVWVLADVSSTHWKAICLSARVHRFRRHNGARSLAMSAGRLLVRSIVRNVCLSVSIFRLVI